MADLFQLECVDEFTTRIKPRDSFRLSPTVSCHGWYQTPPFGWDGHTLTRVDALPSGRLVRWEVREERVISRGKAELAVRVEPVAGGKKAREVAREFTASLAVNCLNLEWNLQPFYRLARRFPGLRQAPLIGAGRILHAPTVWEDCSKALCGTNIQWKQAVRIIEHLGEMGTPHSRDKNLRGWPTPAQILAVGEKKLRDVCRLGYRAPYLLLMAERFAAGEAGQADLAKLSTAECFKFFTSLPGLGPSTASYLVQLYGHLDRMVVDSSVRGYVRDHYTNGKMPTDDEIRALFERYAPFQGLGHWMEWGLASGWITPGEPEPKKGGG